MKTPKLDPITLRHCARVLREMARAHRKSLRNLHDIPEAVALHRTEARAHEHAAEIFEGEAADARAKRRVEGKQKRGTR